MSERKAWNVVNYKCENTLHAKQNMIYLTVMWMPPMYLSTKIKNKKWTAFQDSFKSFYICEKWERTQIRKSDVVNRKEHMWDSMDVTYMISKQRLVRNAWISFWGYCLIFLTQPFFHRLSFPSLLWSIFRKSVMNNFCI